MQINTTQARICILALETCGITEQPEHDEIWATHHHLQDQIMNEAHFRAMERNGEMPVNLPPVSSRDQLVRYLIALKDDCCKAYKAASHLQSQPGDDMAMTMADATFEAAVRDVV